VTFGGATSLVVPAPGVSSATQIGTVTPTVSSLTGGGPNEPSGMTTVLNTGPLISNPAITTGGTWTAGPNSVGRSIVTTLTNETNSTGGQPGQSPLNLSRASPSGLVFTFPTNLAGGFEPVFAYVPFLSAPQTGWLYYTWTHLTSSNWTNGGNVSAKLIYLQAGSGNATNHVITLHGDTLGVPQHPLYLVTARQNPNLDNLPTGNIGLGFETQESPVPTFGTPWQIEVLMTPESVPGAGNGSYYHWINGTLYYSSIGNVQWLASGTTAGYGALKLQPIYGGGSFSPPAVLTFTYNNLYASVK
jgi:hypothetical protein